MPAYYNEFDPDAAQWLRNLIKRGVIAPGDVDERSIEDVTPRDLLGYTQCHFFAGIGVWSYALRRAGWRDDRRVWTGSCPCQPFSSAGKGEGFADERHLWPAFFHLISECRPPVVFGEQVASKDGLAWLDTVQADMEGQNYTSGALDLCAAGFGAPHIRQRLFFVAYDHEKRLGALPLSRLHDPKFDAEPCSLAGTLAYAELSGDRGQEQAADHGGTQAYGPADRAGGCGRPSGALDDAISIGRGAGRDDDAGHDRLIAHPAGLAGVVGDAISSGLEGHGWDVHAGYEPGRLGADAARPAPSPGATGNVADPLHNGLQGIKSTVETSGGRRPAHESSPGPTNGSWADAVWLACRDGKSRPAQRGAFPLAYGPAASLGRGKSTLGGMARSNRVLRLRGYGNAIVSDVAEGFIRAAMEYLP